MFLWAGTALVAALAAAGALGLAVWAGAARLREWYHTRNYVVRFASRFWQYHACLRNVGGRN